MNNSSRLTRIAVLSVFVLLLSAFVAYRTGAFDKWLKGNKETSPLQEDLNIASNYMLDTVPKKDSNPDRTIMSSSKSIIVTEKYDFFTKKDKKKKKDKKRTADTAAKPQPTIMYGSKSAPVFTPKKDTVKKDQ